MKPIDYILGAFGLAVGAALLFCPYKVSAQTVTHASDGPVVLGGGVTKVKLKPVLPKKNPLPLAVCGLVYDNPRETHCPDAKLKAVLVNGVWVVK